MRLADIKPGVEYAVEFAKWGGRTRCRVLEVGVARTWTSTGHTGFSTVRMDRNDGVRVVWLQDAGNDPQPAPIWWERNSSDEAVVASRFLLRTWEAEADSRARDAELRKLHEGEQLVAYDAAEQIALALEHDGVEAKVEELRGGAVCIRVTGSRELAKLAGVVALPARPVLTDALRMVLVECHQGGACAGAWVTLRRLCRLGMVEKDDTRLANHSVTEYGKAFLQLQD